MFLLLANSCKKRAKAEGGLSTRVNRVEVVRIGDCRKGEREMA